MKDNKGKNCVLPVALDIENHGGKGRADTIWDTRYTLVQELINNLKKRKIDTIVYSNAQTANLFLSELKTKFWLAYYPERNIKCLNIGILIRINQEHLTLNYKKNYRLAVYRTWSR